MQNRVKADKGTKAAALKKLRQSLKQQGTKITQATKAILALLARTTPEVRTPQCPRCHSRALIATELMPIRQALHP